MFVRLCVCDVRGFYVWVSVGLCCCVLACLWGCVFVCLCVCERVNEYMSISHMYGLVWYGMACVKE